MTTSQHAPFDRYRHPLPPHLISSQTVTSKLTSQHHTTETNEPVSLPMRAFLENINNVAENMFYVDAINEKRGSGEPPSIPIQSGFPLQLLYFAVNPDQLVLQETKQDLQFKKQLHPLENYNIGTLWNQLNSNPDTILNAFIKYMSVMSCLRSSITNAAKYGHCEEDFHRENTPSSPLQKEGGIENNNPNQQEMTLSNNNNNAVTKNGAGTEEEEEQKHSSKNGASNKKHKKKHKSKKKNKKRGSDKKKNKKRKKKGKE